MFPLHFKHNKEGTEDLLTETRLTAAFCRTLITTVTSLRQAKHKRKQEEERWEIQSGLLNFYLAVVVYPLLADCVLVFSHRLLLVIIIPLISFAQSSIPLSVPLSSAVLYYVPSFTCHLPFLFSICFYVHPSSRYKSRRHDPHFQRWSGIHIL